MKLFKAVSRYEQFAVSFSDAARQAGRDEVFIAACLGYSRPLLDKGLPVIFDLEHFSALVGYQIEYVRAAAYGGEQFYRRYSIPKRAGGHREIAEPLPSLKEIQRWLLDNVFARVPASRFAKGFVLGQSIKDNARFHRHQPKVLAIDFKDFFPSISRGRVFALLRSFGYSRAVSNVLARLCCLRDVLPQGAPTSPAISNLVCRRLDSRLGAYALKRGYRYTRYADDLTFSGDLKPGQVIRMVRKVASDEGLTVHPDKIRLMQPHQRQEVTGIVVNSHLQAPRPYRRELRQALYYINKFGADGHIAHVGEERSNYLAHLLGRVRHVLFLCKRDEKASSWRNDLARLLSPTSAQS